MLTPDNLHPYQQDSITQLYERSAVLGSLPTGAGKTVIGLSAFKELQDDRQVRQGVVIGTKRIATSVWPKEPALWSHINRVQVTALTGTPKQRTEKLKSPLVDLFSLSFNNVKWLADQLKSRDLDDPIFDILIIDESSFLKDPKGEWGKTISKLRKRFRNVWMLTGSPRPNSLLNLYRPMSILSDNSIWGRSFYKWRQKYFYASDFMGYNWEPHSFAEEQLMRDAAEYSFKVPMEAVPRPASDPIIHKVKLPHEAAEAYKTMERQLFSRVGDNLEDAVIAFSEAVASGKLAQIAQGFLYDTDDDDTRHTIYLHNEKIKVLDELLTSSEGLATVILYWFEEDLKRIKATHPDTVVLGAGVSETEGLEIEQAWNSGKIKKLALHPASAGHGLNLQKIKAQIIHYSITWSAELYAQAVARVARQGYAGGKEEWFVLNHHIVSENTVDELKIDRIQGKISAEQAALKYIHSVRLKD